MTTNLARNHLGVGGMHYIGTLERNYSCTNFTIIKEKKYREDVQYF